MRWVAAIGLTASLIANGYLLWKVNRVEKGSELNYRLFAAFAKSYSKRKTEEDRSWKWVESVFRDHDRSLKHVGGEVKWCEDVRRKAKEIFQEMNRERMDTISTLPSEALPSGLPPAG